MAKKLNYASLYTLRSDGRYQGYYRDASGKRHVVCDRDPERLYRKLDDLQNPTPLTFRDIAEAWKSDAWAHIRTGTQVCYNPAYNRAVDLFGDREATSIEPFEIKAQLDRMKDMDYSAQTIKIQRVVYKLIYRHAITDEIIGKQIRTNPVLNVPLPSNMKKAEKREAPEDEIVTLIRRSADDYFGLYPLFLMSTGFRRGEALAIQWQDVDFKKGEISCTKQVNYEGGTLQITEPKTDAGVRVVPILPDLKRKLQMPESAKPTDYVFYGASPDKPLTETMYRHRWMQYCKSHGLVQDNVEQYKKNGRMHTKHHYKSIITAHVFRHGYATLLFEADVDVFTAQKLIGHADVKTTMAVYTHLRNRKNKDSLDKLNAHVQNEIAAV